jgi:hypothetical protein
MASSDVRHGIAGFERRDKLQLSYIALPVADAEVEVVLRLIFIAAPLCLFYFSTRIHEEAAPSRARLARRVRDVDSGRIRLCSIERTSLRANAATLFSSLDVPCAGLAVCVERDVMPKRLGGALVAGCGRLVACGPGAAAAHTELFRCSAHRRGAPT